MRQRGWLIRRVVASLSERGLSLWVLGRLPMSVVVYMVVLILLAIPIVAALDLPSVKQLSNRGIILAITFAAAGVLTGVASSQAQYVNRLKGILRDMKRQSWTPFKSSNYEFVRDVTRIEILGFFSMAYSVIALLVGSSFFVLDIEFLKVSRSPFLRQDWGSFLIVLAGEMFLAGWALLLVVAHLSYNLRDPSGAKD